MTIEFETKRARFFNKNLYKTIWIISIPNYYRERERDSETSTKKHNFLIPPTLFIHQQIIYSSILPPQQEKTPKNCPKSWQKRFFFPGQPPKTWKKKNVTNTQTRKTQKTTTFPRKKPRPETNRNKPVKPDSTSTSTDQPDGVSLSTESSSHRGTIRLLELPAKESRNKKVSFEDRKGTTSWRPNSMGRSEGVHGRWYVFTLLIIPRKTNYKCR